MLSTKDLVSEKDFEVIIDPPNKVNTNITPNDDGTYKCTYTLTLPGKHEIIVKVLGKLIKGNPIMVPVTTGLDPDKSNVLVNDTKMTITVRDKDGNLKDVQPDAMEVDVQGPGKLTPKFVSNGDNVSFNPSKQVNIM